MRVIKFGAIWCNGCVVMKPRWQKIEQANPWLKNEYHDFDQDKEAVDKYGITTELPAFIFVDKEENEFMRLFGEVSEDKLMEIITANKDC